MNDGLDDTTKDVGGEQIVIDDDADDKKIL